MKLTTMKAGYAWEGTVFRAVDSTDHQATFGKGLYVTDEIEAARSYGKKIEKYHVKVNNVLGANTNEYEAIRRKAKSGKWKNTHDLCVKIGEQIKKVYDAVYAGHTFGLVLYNPDKQIIKKQEIGGSMKISKRALLQALRIGEDGISNEERKNLSKLLNRILEKTYFKAIPIKEIMTDFKSLGVVVVQEDGTEFEGMLLGRSSKATFELAFMKNVIEEGREKIYKKIENAMLVLAWHKMESGNYEVTGYIS